MSKKFIHVAVGIVLRAGQIFLTKRADDAHQGGKWEFPGGKVELNESVDEALSRELSEEIGITLSQSQPYVTIEHDYPEKSVRLDFHLVRDFDGEPSGCEGQAFQWVTIDALATLTFPDANQLVVDKLMADETLNAD